MKVTIRSGDFKDAVARLKAISHTVFVSFDGDQCYVNAFSDSPFVITARVKVPHTSGEFGPLYCTVFKSAISAIRGVSNSAPVTFSRQDTLSVVDLPRNITIRQDEHLSLAR